METVVDGDRDLLALNAGADGAGRNDAALLD